MIIGVSGKIGSGKDTVGKIIQYLTNKSKLTKEDTCYKRIIHNLDIEGYHNSNWEIKKFADALKDMICLLIGCTRSQLEDINFKNTELSKEWWYYAYRVQGEKHITMIPYIGAIIPKHLNEEVGLVKPTPRLLLQLLGTECGRNIIHPNVWVNAVFSKYKSNGAPYNSLGDLYDDLKHCPSETKLPNWIITDVRFPNEANVIKEKDGILIRVNRDTTCKVCGSTKDERCDKSYNEITCPNGRPEHESETALDDYEFDYVINNDGSIEQLIACIKIILIKEKLL